ncbi:hypothetical protein [Alkalicoccobacillus gibsonii]|uniref:hypothetical protein n=1 Tax=Alkalicoccobacillus gibsonii TaxID=79881 RepID=UPI00351750D1
MTSFMTLLKRDLRLQVPMMLIYSAVLVLIAGGFTLLAMEVNAGAFGFLLFIFIAQFLFLGIALPINAIWKEWRMKTVAHWLMLPASVHKKIWSKTLSVLIWTIYIAGLVFILWALTGLIGETVIHTGTYDLLKFVLNSDLIYIIPALLIYFILGTFPYFLGVIMVKGEGGWKGPIFAGLIIFFFVVIYPLLTIYNPLNIFEVGPIYIDFNFTQGEFSFSDSDFSFTTTGDSSGPITYVSNLLFDFLLYASFYVLSWWYLARKVEI